MPSDLALLSTLIGSNYPCLEIIFMVPKVFEPLKFDYILISILITIVVLCYLSINLYSTNSRYEVFHVIADLDKSISPVQFITGGLL